MAAAWEAETISNRLLAAIISSSHDAIVSKTATGAVTSWNQAAERIFGYSAAEMIGHPISVLAVPGNRDEMPNTLARLCRGERVEQIKTQRRHKNGSIVDVSLSFSPIHDDTGNVIGASKIARDIGLSIKAAADLRSAQCSLHALHGKLLHAARLGELSMMAETLAHEINQPLSAISYYISA